jgi:hypothetical protein
MRPRLFALALLCSMQALTVVVTIPYLPLGLTCPLNPDPRPKLAKSDLDRAGYMKQVKQLR